MSNEEEFLRFSREQLTKLLTRIETCVAKLTPDQVWARGGGNENAVGNLVLHLAGNVRQWIISGVGGAPDHRDRDSEFEAKSGDDYLLRLRSTVEEAIAVLAALPPANLSERKTIQKHYSVTVLEAIYHVVEHFSMHTGQIIFATKLLTGEDLGFYNYLKSRGLRRSRLLNPPPPPAVLAIPCRRESSAAARRTETPSPSPPPEIPGSDTR